MNNKPHDNQNFTAKQQLGSDTAKGGFANEHAIVAKFNQFRQDNEAQQWLALMGYDIAKIEKLTALQIPTRINRKKSRDFAISEDKFDETQKFKKADIQIQLTITIDDIIYRENISLKKAKKSANFNQIDKRSVNTYQSMWQFDDEVATTLKQFTGEIIPNDDENKDLKDPRRWYLTELPEDKVNKLVQFLQQHKTLIISDIIKGRGMLSAEWFLVTQENSDNSTRWILKNINEVINFYAQGEVLVNKNGNLCIGRLTAQRKGGTPDPTSLQFKIKPLDLFELA